MYLSIGEEADTLKCVPLCELIGLNCLMAWFVDLKEEDLFLDDVIEACFENFFDPTFTKSFLRPDLVLVRRLAGQFRIKMSR